MACCKWAQLPRGKEQKEAKKDFFPNRPGNQALCLWSLKGQQNKLGRITAYKLKKCWILQQSSLGIAKDRADLSRMRLSVSIRDP